MSLALFALVGLIGCTPEPHEADVSVNGDVSCDACGPVVIAAFDNATMTGAPLTDTTRDGPGPFALTFPADFGDVWMFAFADDNNNHAPDPDEIQISAGPYGIGQTALDIGTLELTNDPTPTDAAIDITGNLSCFEGCHPPFLLVFLEPTNDDVLASAVVESEGDYTVRIPHELGEVDVFAIEDLNQNQRYEPGEFFGAREATLAIGREGIDGVDLEIVYDESDWEIGGVRDALGTPTAPDELIVTLETDANAADIAAAIDGTIADELPSLNAVVLHFDAETLSELEAVEATLSATPGVLEIRRSATLIIPASRQTDDNDSQSASATWAYDRMRAREAKDLYDGCAYQFTEASQFSRHVDIAVVDFDLQGARDGSEFKGLVGSYTDHYKTRAQDSTTNGGHGSSVSSVIGALNNTAGMNGMLAGFSGTTDGVPYDLTYSLHLHNMGHATTSDPKVSKSTTASFLGAIEGAAKGPATVINISIGWYVKTLGGHRAMTDERAQLARIIDANPQKVFVLSAGNDNRDLVTGFHLSSLDRPNLFVIGATDVTDTRASFSNYGSFVDFSAPGVGVLTFEQNVQHTSSGSTLSTFSYPLVNGTSFSAPIVTAHVAFGQAMNPLASPATIASRLSVTGDPAPKGLGRMVHFRRFVQFHIEQEINTTTDWLMDLDTTITSISGDAGCNTVATYGGHQCIALVGANTFDKAWGTTDHNGNDYTLSGSLVSKTVGSEFNLAISGSGLTHGIGPATHTYKGEVKTDPIDLDPIPGDVYTTGTFTQTTTTPYTCTFKGSFEAWMFSSTGQP